MRVRSQGRAMYAHRRIDLRVSVGEAAVCVNASPLP